MLMTGVLSVFLFLVTNTWAELSWENCHGGAHDMKLLNVSVTPHPVVAPGTVTIEIALENEQEIVAPVHAALTLKKKMLLGSVPVPCVGGIGSCSFDDVCSICSECGCPLKPGIHVLKMPITIYADSWAILGNYQGQVELETASGLKGCVKVYNVHLVGRS